MAYEPPPVPLTVKPRRESRQWFNIVTADRENLYREASHEILPLGELSALVASDDPFVLVSHNVAHLVAALDEEFNSLPRWQFKVTPVDREIWRPERRDKPTVIRHTVVGFFGFAGAKVNGTRYPNRYHHCLDPHLFCLTGIHDLIPGEASTLEKLFRWASAVREWSYRQGIPFKPSSGGIAAALLRDSRFYPEPRRKVPAATNARVRCQLPGNYYRLLEHDERKSFTATYVDQSRAHHTIARDLPLPCANRLYAKGRFSKGDEFGVVDPDVAPWARAGSRLFDRYIGEHGLFYLTIENPIFTHRQFPLPCQETPGRHRAFVWSNEIPYLVETGTTIIDIVAAWTADTTDTGLSRYAQWALNELGRESANLCWLKPTLLATYGILAAKPKPLEFGYRKSLKGTPEVVPVGGRLLEVKMHRTTNARESSIANVIHRGMIESETRLRSIKMARDLQDQGLRVLAIYADSVFVESAAFPLLPAGWEIEAHLTGLRFFNSTSFTSQEMTKLPGIPREDRDKIRDLTATVAAFRRAGRGKPAKNPA